MRRYVVNEDAVASESGSSAGADAGADFKAVDRRVIEIRQAGRHAIAKAFAFTVEQEDTAKHPGIELLHALHNGFKNSGERCISRQQFQNTAAKLFVLLGLLAPGDVNQAAADQPATG